MSSAVTAAAHEVGRSSSTNALRRALRLNACFSAGTGLLLVLASPWFTSATGLGPSWLVAGVGLSLMAFATLVAWVSVQRARQLHRTAALVTIADLGWVIASLVLLVGTGMLGLGVVLVSASAIAVGLLATLQVDGRRQVEDTDPLADFEVLETRSSLDAPPERVWPIVSDHELYGRLAPNLSRVDVISAGDETLRRSCSTSSGQSWEESCTLWDEGRRFAVEVDQSGYPYPVTSMQGLWQVEAAGAESLVTMRFVYQPEPNLAGAAFAVGASALLRFAVSRIVKGWRARL